MPNLDLTQHVTPAAALRDKTPPVVRLCSFCGDRLPGGIVKHPRMPRLGDMTTVDDADTWWHSQSAERRLTIYGWLHRGHHTTHTAPVDGQLEMPYHAGPPGKATP